MLLKMIRQGLIAAALIAAAAFAYQAAMDNGADPADVARTLFTD